MKYVPIFFFALVCSASSQTLFVTDVRTYQISETMGDVIVVDMQLEGFTGDFEVRCLLFDNGKPEGVAKIKALSLNPDKARKVSATSFDAQNVDSYECEAFPINPVSG